MFTIIYATYGPIAYELEHWARIAVGRGCAEGRRAMM